MRPTGWLAALVPRSPPRTTDPVGPSTSYSIINGRVQATPISAALDPAKPAESPGVLVRSDRTHEAGNPPQKITDQGSKRPPPPKNTRFNSLPEYIKKDGMRVD